jgi:electron transfer flavoprotein beta subunit
MKSFKIVVLAKQVPDTRNVGKDAMKANGTVNRAALPAIFNPEDLKALEQALRIKDKYPETTVSLITMGPLRAAEIIREGLFRGADNGYLVTDRRFAGSDTLATSYVLALTIKKLMPVDIIICGRQAIDGDTAQVGPQVAEKLHMPQVTYAEEIRNITDKKISIKRRLERGTEEVESPFPLLITVHGSAPGCRARHAKLMLRFKHAKTLSELQHTSEDYLKLHDGRPYLDIPEWTVDDLKADTEKLGISGSPTKVKKVTNVVFTAKEARVLSDSDTEVESLMKELIENHTIG